LGSAGIYFYGSSKTTIDWGNSETTLNNLTSGIYHDDENAANIAIHDSIYDIYYDPISEDEK
jgi:hypothetical protein